MLSLCGVSHLILFFCDAYREIFSAQTDMFGQFMRLFEIACIPLYFYLILFSIELISFAMIREHTVSELTNPNLSMACNYVDFVKFSGRTVEWLLIEVFVWTFFISTMLLTMIKSRFMPVGGDNSAQFENVYMSYLANKILKDIDLDKEDAELFYVEKERLVQVNGVMLKICLSHQDFRNIIEKKPI